VASYQELIKKLIWMLKQSVRTSTGKTYRSGWSALNKFANKIGIDIQIPLSQKILCLFIAYEVDKVQLSTLRVYLSGIKHYHSQLGFNLDFNKMILMNQLMKSYRRLRAGETPNKKLPITTGLLSRIVKLINIKDPDDILLIMIASLGIYGLLRSSEFLNDKKPLFWNALIKFNKDSIVIRFNNNKVEMFQQGFNVAYFRNNSPSCPIKNLILYLASLNKPPTSTQPLFQKKDGSIATKSWVVKKLQQFIIKLNLPSHLYTGHSFRRGGATSLAECGVPDNVIKSMGRWNSWAYQLYITPTTQQLKQASIEMGQSTVVLGSFDPSAQFLNSFHNLSDGLGFP
jgi:hypothetical protein